MKLDGTGSGSCPLARFRNSALNLRVPLPQYQSGPLLVSRRRTFLWVRLIHVVDHLGSCNDLLGKKKLKGQRKHQIKNKTALRTFHQIGPPTVDNLRKKLVL
jgi:hypothetical protein